jgi:predicted PurR-regulated permease PerM
VPRALAVVGVFLVLILVVVVALLLIIIPTVEQIQTLVRNPQVLARQATALSDQAQSLPYVGKYVVELDQDRILQLLKSNAPSAGQVFNGALGFIGGVFGVFGTILNLLLMLIVSIYLLLDRERISGAALNAVPVTVRAQTVELFQAVESTLVKYLKTQLLLCAIMGTIGGAIAYFTFGRYALLIGLWVGVTEIIPVIGPFLGAIPAVVIALFSGGFAQALLVALLFLLAQQLEGNVLVPRIMGSSVGVHPLWVLFATLAASALYGVIGALFAVPTVAIITAVLRYLRGTLLFERWGKSPVTEVILEVGKPEPAVPGKEPAGLRSSAGRKG